MLADPILSPSLEVIAKGRASVFFETPLLGHLRGQVSRLLQIKWRFWLAASFVLILTLASVQPRWLTSRDPLEADASAAFSAPDAVHLLGADENGRDVFTRLVYGARASLLMGLSATAIDLGLGMLLGAAAGLGPKALDGAIMRCIDVLLAFPHLLLALVIITFWGQGLVNAILAVGMASVPRYARLVRSQTHTVRHASYVEAARTQGFHPLVLIWRHVLPNAIKPVLVLATIGIGETIAAGASLSFLGFGNPPPAPEWGAMLASGRNFILNAYWLTVIPGLAITFTILSLSTLGRELRRRTEGKNT